MQCTVVLVSACLVVDVAPDSLGKPWTNEFPFVYSQSHSRYQLYFCAVENIRPFVPSLPVPVAARCKAWVCGRSPPEIVGSNLTGGMDVCCECCVLSGRGLCDELITRSEESYRLWCVVCDLETS